MLAVTSISCPPCFHRLIVLDGENHWYPIHRVGLITYFLNGSLKINNCIDDFNKPFFFL